ncbi:DNA mismatch repair endonuclease MutL [Bdellovibrionota bacterium FG-1]
MISPARQPRPVRILSANVAERIAAGEVIERPASVVKEMVENSIDAGATEVCVALEDGGKSLIEITDNGFGMSPEDLALCVVRHATSKLSTMDDLEKIHTLGFRGEALPSVAAVSELSILSRALGASAGAAAYELKLPAVNDQERFEDRRFDPNAVTFGHFLNSPHGTRIQARGLFAHIPARLKFLKAQGAEVAQAREWIERIALAHPHVGFRLLSDRRQILNLRPQDEKTRVRAILGDGEDYPILSATNDLGIPNSHGDGQGLHVRIHWLQGLSSPQMRRMVQVVNGRAVRDRMLQQALMAPFRQALLPGQFPAVALYVDINPAWLDVNVHPTKTEIRFLESRKIFHAVDETIQALIAREGAPAFASGPSNPTVPSTPFAWTRPTVSSSTDWKAAESYTSPTPDFATTILEQAPLPIETHAVEQSANPLRYGRLAGTLFNTYLFYEIGNELAIVDQHAAHERIRYEQLKARVLNPPAGVQTACQALLIPEAVHFDTEGRSTLEARLGWLDQLGFEAEIFGENTVLFRGIPGEWGTSELRPRLKNLVDRILSYDGPSTGTLQMDESLFESLASEACHSAIRAGDRLEIAEASALVHQLFQCEHPWNCPHGRPTVVKVPRARFEEWFLRRV